MNRFVDILTFQLNTYLSLGILTSEVRNVVQKIDDNSFAEADVCDIFKMFGCPAIEKYSSLLVIENKDQSKSCFIKIPALLDIKNINILSIVPVPELIRKKQSPLFVWGFIKKQDAMTVLVTFSEMMENK